MIDESPLNHSLDPQTLEIIQEAFKSEELDSLIPLMPLFRMRGEEYNLSNHWCAEPFFKIDKPARNINAFGRQSGKTANNMGRTIITAAFMDKFRSLVISPRYKQVARISTEEVAPLIKTSIVKDIIVDGECAQSISQRSFTNDSVIYFDSVYKSPDSIRGLAYIADINIDEFQDINHEFLPVIEQVMAAHETLGFLSLSGTAKTLDNSLNVEWEKSSKSHWNVPCEFCGHVNIGSVDSDLFDMIGTDGPICSICNETVHPIDGEYVHTRPDRISSYTGYHFPQILHPVHYNNEKKWDTLLKSYKEFTKATFVNEICGMAFDSSDKIITIKDVENSYSRIDNPIENTLDGAIEACKAFTFISCGIDWSGGGAISESFTTISFTGVTAFSDKLTCFYTTRMRAGLSIAEEMTVVIKLASQLRADVIAHDQGGAGNVRHAFLLSMGISPGKLLPVTYTHSPNKAIFYKPITTSAIARLSQRPSWSLDKTRSILTLAEMIKAGMVILSKPVDLDDPIYDLTHVQLEVTSRVAGSDVTLINRTPGQPDDGCHSINLSCWACWKEKKSFPDVASAHAIKMTAEQIEELLAEPEALREELKKYV